MGGKRNQANKSRQTSRKKPRTTHAAVDYLRNIGGGLSLLGLIGIFPFPQFYWWGVGSLCVGLIALSLEALLEDWRFHYRVVVCLVWVTLGILFLVKMVFVPAPLEIVALSKPAPYSVGDDVYGIKWELGMSELRLVLHNRTSLDYDDVDIVIRPDVPTRRMAQVTKFADISFTLVHSEDMEVASAHINNQAADIYASENGFRMRCPKIPKHTTIEIVVALIEPPKLPPNSAKPGKILRFTSITGVPNNLIAKQPTRVYVNGDYKVLNRPHRIEFTYGIS